MPRGNYYDPSNPPVIDYVPGFDPALFQMQSQQLQNINKKWDETEQSVAEAIANYGSLPVRDTERPFVQKRIVDFNKSIKDIVDQYGGRYDLASKDIARKMANEAPFYTAAKQAYELQKQYEPLYAKYAQNLLFSGKDPRKQAIFDEQGNYVGMPDFVPYERSDYDKLIQEGVVSGIDKISRETGLSKSKIFGYLEQAKLRGLAALPEGELKERVKSFLPQFMAESTFGFDPNMRGQNVENFVLGRAASLAGSGIDRQYDADWLARTNYQQQLEASEYNRRQGLTNASKPLTRLQGTSLSVTPEEVIDTPITDTGFKGQLKREFIKSRWTNDKGELNPSAFAGKLNEFNTVLKKQQRNPKTNAMELVPYTKVSLADVIQKDQSGAIDVDATLAKIEDLSKRVGGLTDTGGDPVLMSKIDFAKKFMKDINKQLDSKIKQNFGDIEADVMGFDFATDPNAQQRFERMQNYVNKQITPLSFNYETGEFSKIKTKNLADNKDFQDMMKTGNFNITGVVKGKDGDIKYVAETGKGKSQIISTPDESVNRNLLEMFAEPELIGAYNYRNFKLTPSGKLFYTDKNTGSQEELKLKIPNNMRLEKQPDGTYYIIDSNGEKSNQSYDKWKIIHTFGFEKK